VAIWSRYRYEEADYRSLIWSCRHQNHHRYATLLEAPPESLSRGVRALPTREGWVILSPHREKRWAFLQDLLETPLYLEPFVLLFERDRGRVKLQVNRNFVRLKLHIIDEMTHYGRGKRGPEAHVITPAEFISAVNQVTAEMSDLNRYAWTYPETLVSYNARLRCMVRGYLIGSLKLPREEANAQLERYLREWWPPKKGERAGLVVPEDAAKPGVD